MRFQKLTTAIRSAIEALPALGSTENFEAGAVKIGAIFFTRTDELTIWYFATEGEHKVLDEDETDYSGETATVFGYAYNEFDPWCSELGYSGIDMLTYPHTKLITGFPPELTLEEVMGVKYGKCMCCGAVFKEQSKICPVCGLETKGFGENYEVES